MNPEGQRFRLFETVSALLAAISASHPTLVVFDDLHWADQPSLLMLRHVARSSESARLCIVANYRDSEVTHRHQEADGRAKRGERLADPRLDVGDRSVQRGDVRQVQVEEETMVGGHPAVQRLHQFHTGGLQPPPRGEVRQALGVVSPATKALRMARPLAPRMSLITSVSFTLASSRVF